MLKINEVKKNKYHNIQSWEKKSKESRRGKFDFYTIFSRVLRDSTPRFVRRSVGRLVSRLVTLYFFYDFISMTSLLLLTWSGNLK